MLNNKDYINLNKLTKIIRKDILFMCFNAQSAHAGGALSCVEILTVLYFEIMKVYPKDPLNDYRDRLIFSKAHDAKALYSVLCRRGFFKEETLRGYEVNNGTLPGHSTRHCAPGVEASAGSLGHGLPMAVGMALSAKLDKKKHKIFAILSDGECDEGSTWEAVIFASQHKLDNLTVIVDYNKLQGYGFTKDILDLDPFLSKWKAFGWEGKEINGNSIKELYNVLISLPIKKDKPNIIIAHTIKGLGGVNKYVNTVASQYKPPTKEEYKETIKNL